MDQNVSLFRKLSPAMPPVELQGAVLSALRVAERRRVITQLASAIAVNALSFVALIVSFRWVAVDAARSGFFEFLSAATADAEVLAAYWQDFAAALLESVPTFGLLLLLSAAFTGLRSLRAALRDLARMRNLKLTHA